MPRELLAAGVPLVPEIELDDRSGPEELKATLTGLVARGQGARAIDHVRALVVDLERINDRLAWRVLREVRFWHGRSTERLSREELGQLYLALGGGQPTAESSSDTSSTSSSEIQTRGPDGGNPTPKRQGRRPGARPGHEHS